MKNKKANFSEWYTEITKEAQLCDLRYNVKGFVVFMPWSVISMKRMYGIYERELERTGHKPAWFPALIPESNFHKESQHVEGFTPQVFWVEKAGDNKLEERLAMRPTSETAIYQMYSLWIQGKSDLPLKIYHPSQVWRYETKATRPFIRSREFYWIEAHDAFATRKEAEEQVRQDMEMCRNVIWEQFGVPFIFFERPQWDKFPGADATYAADTMMPDGRVLQLPSTHLLGQNFAKAFNVAYLNERGEREYCHQTCYGPAISRIYAAVISIHGDDAGLVLPFELAPIQAVVVPIPQKGKEEEVSRKAEEVVKALCESGIRAEGDFSESTPGFKFNFWEMRGVPFRVEVGLREKESGIYTVVRRDNRKKEQVGESELASFILAEARRMLEDMKRKAQQEFEAAFSRADSLEKLSSELENGKLVASPLCTIEKEGEECAKAIKEKTGGDVRGIRFDKREKAHGACIACGKKAQAVVYIARQY
ncbi:MAG: proline--tRNA ligase [Candidatus Micrarchaeota archaeon]|nr:proline--tRNA ligase [Candidatus Micrarchaeota archaeon]